MVGSFPHILCPVAEIILFLETTMEEPLLSILLPP